MQNQLISEFEEIQNNLNGKKQDVFNQSRIKAIEAFGNLSFPTKKDEEWKYSDVKKLVNATYNFHPKSEITHSDLESFELPDLEGIILYFVNGIYHPELSNVSDKDGRIKISTLQEAINDVNPLLTEHYGKYLKSETDAFTAMNSALANDGILVEIPDNVTLEQPIILRMINDTRKENVGSIIRNLIVVGQNAEVKIAEAYRSFGEESGFVNAATEVYVGKDARVDYYKVQNDNDVSYHVGTTQVYLADNSYFYSATITLNGGFVRNNLNLVLDGEHIESHMYGLYIPNKKQHIDNHTVVDHCKPNSVSNELYKGILMDNSTGVFNGKIFVRQIAQKTNAYQNCRNVIISDKASMNTKPQLEIWADDVKCSHGTTTGQLNDEAIFYMQSRGIPKKEAVKLQLLAFASDVVSQIKIDTLRDYLEELVKIKLDEIN